MWGVGIIMVIVEGWCTWQMGVVAHRFCFARCRPGPVREKKKKRVVERGGGGTSSSARTVGKRGGRPCEVRVGHAAKVRGGGGGGGGETWERERVRKCHIECGKNKKSDRKKNTS